MGFPSEHVAVHHVRNILSGCTDLSCFSVCYLKRFFTLTHDAVNDHNWLKRFFTLSHDAMNDHNWSIFFLRVMGSWWSRVFFWSGSHTSASAAFKPPNDFSFLRHYWSYVFPLVSSTSFSHIWIFWSHYNSFMISIRSILCHIKSRDY